MYETLNNDNGFWQIYFLRQRNQRFKSCQKFSLNVPNSKISPDILAKVQLNLIGTALWLYAKCRIETVILLSISEQEKMLTVFSRRSYILIGYLNIMLRSYLFATWNFKKQNLTLLLKMMTWSLKTCMLLNSKQMQFQVLLIKLNFQFQLSLIKLLKMISRWFDELTDEYFQESWWIRQVKLPCLP